VQARALWAQFSRPAVQDCTPYNPTPRDAHGILRPMGTPTACGYCGKPILPSEDKVTIQDAAYHSRCWDKKERGRERRA